MMFGPQNIFGFRTIKPEQKQAHINKVFLKIAPNHDVVNDLMSAGINRLWKDELPNWLDPKPHGMNDYHLLDVAGGTGDIAIRIAH